ncbi:hypothetical protein C0989_002781 [Termitomyces sp. Mn162]|nr:hypothetical protein C0989_002781 [Termitomyces sp. Mn162]
MAPVKYWLLKAEPHSRLVKGKDVKALFYHSNCKNPGIAAFAEVSKEAYPDCRCIFFDPSFLPDDWTFLRAQTRHGTRNYPFNHVTTVHSDQILPSHRSHPYYDAKTKKDDPRWFMVDLKFVSRATHFVPLALLRFLSDSNSLRPEINYIQEDGLKALKAMDLVGRGRLSVQRVEGSAWNAIVALAEKGGWEEMDLKVKGKRPAKSAMTEPKPKPARKSSTRKTQDDVKSEEKEEDDEDSSDKALQMKRGTKRKTQGEENSSAGLDTPPTYDEASSPGSSTSQIFETHEEETAPPYSDAPRYSAVFPLHGKPIQGCRASRPLKTEHSFGPQNGGTPWVQLKCISRAASSSKTPKFVGGDDIAGSILLDLASPTYISSITIAVKGRVVTSSTDEGSYTILDKTYTVWSKALGNPRYASSTRNIKHKGNLDPGEYTWPFSFPFPTTFDYSDASGPVGKKSYRTPQSFSEHDMPATVQYQLLLCIRRGALRPDKK